MIVLLIISIVLGTIVAGVTGMGILFWVVAGGIFVFGLPGLIIGWVINGIGGFIHGENDYAQDRADYRELMREIAEDERIDRYLDKLDELDEKNDDKLDIYIDNRQIPFYNTANKDAITNTKRRLESKK
jgi:hypothetical protein